MKEQLLKLRLSCEELSKKISKIANNDVNLSSECHLLALEMIAILVTVSRITQCWIENPSVRRHTQLWSILIDNVGGKISEVEGSMKTEAQSKDCLLDVDLMTSWNMFVKGQLEPILQDDNIMDNMPQYTLGGTRIR
jgi:hypothetical protein